MKTMTSQPMVVGHSVSPRNHSTAARGTDVSVAAAAMKAKKPSAENAGRFFRATV